MKKAGILLFIFIIKFAYGDVYNKLEKIEMKFEQKQESFFKNIADMDIYKDLLFIVDNKDYRVLKFKINKDRFAYQTSIGRLGQGPGDLELPIRLSIWNDILAIHDQQGISFFDIAGNFRTKFRLFSGGISFLFLNERIYHVAANPTQSDLLTPAY